MNTEVKVIDKNIIEKLSNTIKMASSKIMMSWYTKLIGVAMYRFKLNIDDNSTMIPPQGLACVRWTKRDDELTIIPEIWFSPLLSEWDAKEMAFVMIHEIMHTLDMHASRGKNKDCQIWNLAADHVINRRIEQDIKNGNNIVSRPTGIFIVDDWMNEDLLVEEVYDRLMVEAEKNKITITKNADGSYSVDYKGKKYTINPDTDRPEKEESQEGKSEINSIKSAIRGAIESEVFKNQNSRGNTSGGLVEYIHDIVDIKIPWYILLEKAIHKVMPIKSDNRSWRVINKRMRSHGLMLPHNDTEDGVESNLYIVVDNSGSIGTDDLSKFASIIENSSGFFKKVVIFKHDVKIQEILEINDTDADIKEAIKGVGRGGTNHTPVFDELEKRIVTNQDVDDVGMVMMLTDYQSNIEEIWNNYKWVKEIPVKIVLSCNANVAEWVDDSPILIEDIKA